MSFQINELVENLFFNGEFQSLSLELYRGNRSFQSQELLCSNRIDLIRRIQSNHWRNSPNKPIETRILTGQNNQNSKGIVKLWVEMFQQEEELNHPVYDINPYSNPEECEMRVVLFSLFQKANSPMVFKTPYKEFQAFAELEFFPYEVEGSFSSRTQKTEVLYLMQKQSNIEINHRFIWKFKVTEFKPSSNTLLKLILKTLDGELVVERKLDLSKEMSKFMRSGNSVRHTSLGEDPSY